MTDKTVGSLVFCVVQSNPFQNFENTHFLLKKRFFIVIVLELVPQMPNKFFQTFRGEEVPLFTTFYHLFTTLLVLQLSHFLRVV